jgi:hypothetical protein
VESFPVFFSVPAVSAGFCGGRAVPNKHCFSDPRLFLTLCRRVVARHCLEVIKDVCNQRGGEKKRNCFSQDVVENSGTARSGGPLWPGMIFFAAEGLFSFCWMQVGWEAV